MRKILPLSILLLPALFLSGCFWGLSDFHAHLTGVYSLWRTSAFRIDIVPDGSWSDGDPVIPTMVVECNHDERFIIAKRQGLKGKSGNREPDPLVFDYWVLDINEPKVHGPLTSVEFSEKKIELGVPSGLELKSVYSFKPSE